MTSLGALCETLQLNIRMYSSKTKVFCCYITALMWKTRQIKTKSNFIV